MPRGVYTRKTRKPLIDRFFAKVNKTESCWIWTGAKSSSGYGNIACDFDKHGKCFLQLSHRVSWELHKGEIPDGLCVLHACDNPACVNPEHLFLGTKAENSADMKGKGRQKKGKQLPHTRLSESDVKRIRESKEPQKKIAALFGCSQSNVSLIKSRKHWAWVD